VEVIQRCSLKIRNNCQALDFLVSIDQVAMVYQLATPFKKASNPGPTEAIQG
jgi:hypothetical protein